MSDQRGDSSAHVLRFNPSLHEHPWAALAEALDARGSALFLVIDGAIDGARGPITSSAANADARQSVVEQLADASLLSLLVLRGPTVHGDEALALALSCDIRWASPGASLQVSELMEGRLPYAAVSHAAAHRLGTSPALALALRGLPLTSAQAMGWGVVDEVVADHDLDGRIDGLIATTAKIPRGLLAETKALLRVGDQRTARRREAEAQDRLHHSP